MKEKTSKVEKTETALNAYMHARTPEQHALIEAAARQWVRSLQLFKEQTEWREKP